ncbi:hypothetical protein DL990_24845 [Amycolatopsis sp. WAC 01416]|uniref:DUF6653 family protein n=1 Tax=Amycolatopsis sp. WAC 01416 TaxID=2203196 RepID=UPI000F7B6A90|nr:hypothetical protein DL990_24845 [Amycolatopsis sp. WAC 01416]
MDDEAWRRHANPWSAWARFAAIPLMPLAIWSRTAGNVSRPKLRPTSPPRRWTPDRGPRRWASP